MGIVEILADPYFNDVRDSERENMVPNIPTMEFEEQEDLTME
jgi:hypothetical protein